MASFEEELLQDEAEKRREIAFIRKQLPLELKDSYSEELLSWMLDALVDYYVESGILDGEDEEVEIDLEQVAQHLCKQAQKEQLTKLNPDEVRFVVEADLDFQEENI